VSAQKKGMRWFFSPEGKKEMTKIGICSRYAGRGEGRGKGMDSCKTGRNWKKRRKGKRSAEFEGKLHTPWGDRRLEKGRKG